MDHTEIIRRFQDSAREHQHDLPFDPKTLSSPQRPEPSALLTSQELKVTRDNPNPQDTAATKMLLDTYKQDDAWRCPKCGAPFSDPDLFAQHFIDELNTSLANLNTQFRAPTPQSKHNAK